MMVVTFYTKNIWTLKVIFISEALAFYIISTCCVLCVCTQ